MEDPKMFSKEDKDLIKERGKLMVKKFYALKWQAPFDIRLETGVMKGDAGDFIVYDPANNAMWAAPAHFVEQNYEEVKKDG